MTKDTIKNSLDAKWRRAQISTWCIVIGIYICTALFAVLIDVASYNDFTTSFKLFGIAIAATLPLILPFLLYSTWRYFAVIKNVEEYALYEVKLDHPELSYLYRNAVYYTVRFTDKNGNVIVKDTLPLWSSGLFCSIQLADYNNQKVFVAYKESSDTLVVLDKDYKPSDST